MKVFGIFRGFPGLGRVMSGISLLSMFSERGWSVKAYSYFQGLSIITDNSFELIVDNQPENYEVSAIGLNPVGKVAESLIERIKEEKPDLVIVDGEPLLISTLAIVYPRNRIVSLLNPADLYNPAQVESSLEFFRMHYLSAGTAIVHGIGVTDMPVVEDTRGCDVFHLNTIIRPSVLETVVTNASKIVAVLGGGCKNSTEGFFNSTLNMGMRIIEAARMLSYEQFEIYCNDVQLASQLLENVPNNCRVVDEYTDPNFFYQSAKVVLCRAGRNTVSELMYLDIPAILMSSSDDVRAAEQGKNINIACLLRPNKFFESYKSESGSVLVEKILSASKCSEVSSRFIPGNEQALEILEHIVRDNC